MKNKLSPVLVLIFCMSTTQPAPLSAFSDIEDIPPSEPSAEIAMEDHIQAPAVEMPAEPSTLDPMASFMDNTGGVVSGDISTEVESSDIPADNPENMQPAPNPDPEQPREPLPAGDPKPEKFIEITDPSQIRDINNEIGDLTPSLKILGKDHPDYDKSKIPPDHPDWLPVVSASALKLTPKVVDIVYFYDPKTGKYYQSEDRYQPPAPDANVPDISGKKPITFDELYKLVQDMKLKVGDKIVITYKNVQGKVVQETRTIKDIFTLPYRKDRIDGSVQILFEPVKGQDLGVYMGKHDSTTAVIFVYGKTFKDENQSGDVIYSIERPGIPVAPPPTPVNN